MIASARLWRRLLWTARAWLACWKLVSYDPGLQFDDDDLFTLVQVSGSAAQALHNASLLEAERKVEILQTLVQVSGEITSTLNLERVLRAVVNGPGAVVPYERAAIALEQRGRLQLKAISGMEQINPDDPDVSRLREMLQWASLLNEEIFVTQKDRRDQCRPGGDA